MRYIKVVDEDKVIKKLLEHDSRFNQLQGDLSDFKQQVFTVRDEMLTILRRLDQKRIFTTAWVGRIEKEVEAHREEITKLKETLKIK